VVTTENRDWRKSSFTNDLNCVEVRRDHGVVRDTKNRTGPSLDLSPGAFASLVRTVVA
jgi:hypothetical protein